MTTERNLIVFLNVHNGSLSKAKIKKKKKKVFIFLTFHLLARKTGCNIIVTNGKSEHFETVAFYPVKVLAKRKHSYSLD